jgi:anti-sigma-K factor RskA
MPSLLHQLDNESALVMFLAGELPAEDHAVVERRLASDPELRTQFDELRSAYRGVENALAAADAGQRVTLPEATAVRRVGQAVRAWHARRLAMPRERELGGRLRLPRWAYAAASVAVASIVALAIWGIRSDNRQFRLDPLAGTVAPSDSDNSTPSATQYATEFDPYPAVQEASENDALADAEDELFALSQRSPGDVPAMLLVGDTDEQ